MTTYTHHQTQLRAVFLTPPPHKRRPQPVLCTVYGHLKVSMDYLPTFLTCTNYLTDAAGRSDVATSP